MQNSKTMKAAFIFYLLLGLAQLSFAQAKDQFELSEEASLEIVKSTEFQKVVTLQNEFLDKIDRAVKRGTPLDVIQKAFLKAVGTNNYEPVYLMLFENVQNGSLFFENLAASKRAFVEANRLYENKQTFSCLTCSRSVIEEINIFFKFFDVFNENRLVIYTENAAVKSLPTCGSWWNQIKLVGCSALCSVTSGGVGAIACVWSCWCSFCTKNSAVANVICAQ